MKPRFAPVSAFGAALGWVPMGLCLTVAALAGLSMLRQPQIVDFFSFWAGSRLDAGAYRVGEDIAQQVRHFLPLAYPPPLLLLIHPLQQLTYAAAFVLWTAVTLGFYLAMAGLSPRVALGHPSVAFTAMVGQLSFITSGLFLGALRWIDRRPLLSGALFGLLVIKPQLAVLVPLALAAGGHGRAFLAAAASAALVTIAAGAAFGGFETYLAWWAVLGQYADFLRDHGWPWHELASSYALLRSAGAPHEAALTAQLAQALVAAVVTGLAWRGRWPCRAAMLAAASLLVSPYLFTYDALLLALPLQRLAERRQFIPLLLVALFSALPVIGALIGLALPNSIPLAAMVSLLVLAQNRRC